MGKQHCTLRWNHIFNRRLFVNTTVVYNDYKFRFDAGQNDFKIQPVKGIRDINAKWMRIFSLPPNIK
jgi:hypothetical protein